MQTFPIILESSQYFYEKKSCPGCLAEGTDMKAALTLVGEPSSAHYASETCRRADSLCGWQDRGAAGKACRPGGTEGA